MWNTCPGRVIHQRLILGFVERKLFNVWCLVVRINCLVFAFIVYYTHLAQWSPTSGKQIWFQTMRHEPGKYSWQSLWVAQCSSSQNATYSYWSILRLQGYQWMTGLSSTRLSIQLKKRGEGGDWLSFIPPSIHSFIPGIWLKLWRNNITHFAASSASIHFILVEIPSVSAWLFLVFWLDHGWRLSQAAVV